MESGIYAFCDKCGTAVNKIFVHEGELREYIVKNQKCLDKDCNTIFQIGYDGTIWNLKIKVLPNKEEYLLKLLKEVAQTSVQKIFCYEDLGPNSQEEYRYPDKRIEFGKHEWTNRATPAFFMNVFPKESRIIERNYCFTDIGALLQIAREAMKGYYLLKYEKKVDI